MQRYSTVRTVRTGADAGFLGEMQANRVRGEELFGCLLAWGCLHDRDIPKGKMQAP